MFEVRQRISEPALTVCDVCGGAVRRLLSPAPFILKGDGWYVTDYPSESRKKAIEAEKKGAPSAAADKSSAASEAKSDGGGAGDKAATSTPASTPSSTPASS